MAKVKNDGIDKDLLKQIVDASNVEPGYMFVSTTAVQPMTSHVPPLVEFNTGLVDPTDPTKCATRATGDATTYLAAPAASAAGNASGAAASPASSYAIITNAVLPEPKKRGNTFGNGAPTKYPFADMPVGGSFFSANTEHKNNDALKALGSTVSSQNRKYSSPDGDKTKVVKQAVRGPDKKPILGADGKKQIEQKVIPVLKYERKFTIRPVVSGVKYGEWTAPSDGALIARTV